MQSLQGAVRGAGAVEAREATGSPRAGCVAAAAVLRLALVPRVQGGAGHALAGSPERLGVLFGCAVLSRKWSCENSGQLIGVAGAWSCSEDAKTARGAGGSAPSSSIPHDGRQPALAGHAGRLPCDAGAAPRHAQQLLKGPLAYSPVSIKCAPELCVPPSHLQLDMTTIPTAYAVEDPPESTWDPDDCFIVCEDVRVDEPDPEVCPRPDESDPEVCPPTSNVGFSLTPTVSPLLTAAISPTHPLQFARPLPAQAMAGAHATAQAIPAARQMPPAMPFYNPNPLPFYNPYQPVAAPGGYMPSLPQQPHQAAAPPPPVPPFRWDPAAATHLLNGTAGHPVGQPPAAIAPHPFSREPPRPSPLFPGLATAAMVQQQQAAQAAVRADAARMGAAGVAAQAVVQAAAGLQRQAQAAAAAGVPQTVVATTTTAAAAVQGPKAKAAKKEAAPAAAPAVAAEEGLGVCWVEIKAKPGWWPAQIMAAPPMVRPAHPHPCARAQPAHARHCPSRPLAGLSCGRLTLTLTLTLTRPCRQSWRRAAYACASSARAR